MAKVQKIFDIEYENTNTNVRKPQLINVCLGEIWKNKDNKGTSKSNNFCGLSRWNNKINKKCFIRVLIWIKIEWIRWTLRTSKYVNEQLGIGKNEYDVFENNK